MKCIVDTNIFNKLIDGLLDAADLPTDAEFIATHVQLDELNRTKDAERRARLFLSFAETVKQVVPTETTVLNVSRLGKSKLGDGSIYSAIKDSLDALNGGKANNIEDALIAEVAIANGHTLLTGDADLASVARKHGCPVQHFSV